MKKISVNQIISVTRKQPFTGNSLKFLQDALDEDKAGIIKAFITQSIGSYSLTTPYVISGCVVSDAGKDVTAGEIFYGGKYYETTAVNGTTNVARFILTKTQDAVADPLEFTNGDILNVHDIYKYVATDVASGGDFDATDLVSAYGSGKIAVELTNATQTDTGGTFVDMTSLSYTITKAGTYKITLIANPDSANSINSLTLPVTNNNASHFRLYNSSDSIILDEKYIQNQVGLDLSAGGSATLSLRNQDSVCCMAIETFAVGKVIKAQFKTDSASTTTKFNKMFIEEL
jgi:hypothetical protein